MHRLYSILHLFKEYVILSILVVCSIVLLSMNNNPQLQFIRSLAVTVAGIGENTFSFIPNLFALSEENAVLRRRVIELADDVAKLREARLENIRLRKTLGFAASTPLKLQAAKVVGKNLHLLHNTLIINTGSDDSIRTTMPVVSDGGLVGRVTVVSPKYSIVQILLNRDFRASVKIQRSRVDGILAWQGGTTVLIKNVSKSQDVRVGDVVMTSEYSNTFPANIEVGVVSSVSEEVGNLFKNVEVMPSVDFSRLEEVFIVRAVPDTARESILSRLPKE